VSPPSSIRDSARVASRGSGARSNRFYEPSYRHSQESQGRHLFSPPQQQQQQQQQSNQDAPAPRLCYCDQPSDPDCVECAANRFCMLLAILLKRKRNLLNRVYQHSYE
jgi:hypothetical protein